MLCMHSGCSSSLIFGRAFLVFAFDMFNFSVLNISAAPHLLVGRFPPNFTGM